MQANISFHSLALVYGFNSLHENRTVVNVTPTNQQNGSSPPLVFQVKHFLFLHKQKNRTHLPPRVE